MNYVFRVAAIAAAILMAGQVRAAPPQVNLTSNWNTNAVNLNPNQSGWDIPVGYYSAGGYYVPLAVDVSGQIYCNNCSGGGGGGGTVTQGAQAGAASGNTWFTQDVALDALISGGKLPVSEASLPLPTGAATSANQSATLAPVSPATATATNSVLMGCQGASTQPTFTAGQQGYVPCDLSGGIYVHPSGGSLQVYPAATTTGGATWAHYINSASSAMATNVKSSGGNVYRIQACNSNATVAYFHLYNTSSAPTVGATSQLVETIIIPATACIASADFLDVGNTLGTGISFDVTTGSLADTDTTVITTANTVAVTVWSK